MDHDPYAALRLGGYRRLLGGGILAALGTEAQAVAVGWDLYSRTRSTWMLGLTGLVQFLPVLLLALPAGQVADHYRRKRVLQVSLGLLFVASLGLAALSLFEGPVVLVLSCLLLSGIGRAFYAPARTAMLTEVVPMTLVPNAVTWNSSGWQFANVAGPALGGLLVAVSSPTQVYFLAAGCCLAFVVLVAGIQPVERTRVEVARTLQSLLAGVRFVWRNEILLAAITLDLFAVLLGGATALLPVFAEDILEVGPAGLGALRTAPALGALVMAVVLAHRRPLERPGRALLLSVAGFGLATVAFGLSRSFLLSLVLLAITGALDNVSVVVRGTLMQALTPDSMRGRVAAVNSVFISSSNELGAFESGAVATLMGPVASVVIGGVGTVVVVMIALGAWPRLMHLGPLHTLRQVDPDPKPT